MHALCANLVPFYFDSPLATKISHADSILLLLCMGFILHYFSILSSFLPILRTSNPQRGSLPPPLSPSWTLARTSPQIPGHSLRVLFSINRLFNCTLATTCLPKASKLHLNTSQNAFQNQFHNKAVIIMGNNTKLMNRS